MELRRQLGLAVAIAEYDTVLTHLRKLREYEVVRVPLELIGRVTDELEFLAQYWGEAVGGGGDAVAEARAFCTQHGDELEQMLRDEEEANGPSEVEGSARQVGGTT